MAERWLVISHEATNSGAPRVLLEVLREARAARKDWSCEILLRHGGPLEVDFAELGPVHLLAHRWGAGATFRARFLRKFFDRPVIQPRRFAACLRHWRSSRFDLVYNNTATNGYLVAGVVGLGAPIVTHVHELGYAMRRFNTPAALAQTIDHTDQFLAVSAAVAADLVDCGAPAERIAVTPNFLPALPRQPGANERTALRAALALSSDAYVVTGCGHIDWLKGTDLFIETAAALRAETTRKLEFVWLGGETDRRFARRLRRLVRERRLEDVVRFVGAVPDASPWFAASDAVAVTSRYESFSLVALEAGAGATPVVGFAAARGLQELLQEESGWLVPGLNPVGMAAVLLGMLNHPAGANAAAQRFRERIARDFLAALRVPAILGRAAEVLERGRRRP